MKVELVDHTRDSVNKIGHYASICYQAKTDRESNIKRASHCVNRGHLSTLRFGYATFHVELSRVCLAQFTRSKHLDYLVRSSRYCDEIGADFYAPESIVMAGFGADYDRHIKESRQFYCNLRDAGITKQDARFVLPQSQMTELYVCGNFQAWRDFVKLRTTKAAQGEIREIALEIQRQLQAIAPEIFNHAENS